MNIPNTVRIGSNDYLVELTKNDLVCNGKEVWGWIDYSHHVISINEVVADKQSQEQTFLHEILHGIVSDRDLAIENEEAVVDAIAKGLHQIIRDNPDIFTVRDDESTDEYIVKDADGNTIAIAQKS